MTTLTENETILHQRFGDSNEQGGKKRRSKNHQLKVYNIKIWPSEGLKPLISSYLTGEQRGNVEMTVIFDSIPFPDAVETYTEHPWSEQVNFTVMKAGKIGDESIKGSGIMTLFFHTATPNEVEQQLNYFHQMTDHIIDQMRGIEPDSIPNLPTMEETDQVSKLELLQESNNMDSEENGESGGAK